MRKKVLVTGGSTRRKNMDGLEAVASLNDGVVTFSYKENQKPAKSKRNFRWKGGKTWR